MTDRPTLIERAFALAESGEVENLQAIRNRLKGEGYAMDTGQLAGASIRTQLTRLIGSSRKTD